MKTMKKMLSIILAVAMMLVMSLATFADTTTPPVPSADVTATISITNVSGNPTVTVYKVADAAYAGGSVTYTWIDGATVLATEANLTPDNINDIAKKLVTGDITPVTYTVTNPSISGTTYSATVNAGGYIAILSSATDGSVYNPIYLTASYDATGALSTTPVDATGKYLHGSQAVAKKTTPDLKKEITSTNKADTKTDGTAIKTVSVGDKVDYKITPTMPSYPANATNKTLFVSDTMSAGLTFLYDSLAISIEGKTVTKDGNDFKIGTTKIATSVETTNGFNVNFVYDALVDTGAVLVPVITYSAIVNDNAVVGTAGNPNTADLYYANQPNNGTTWTPVDSKPDSAPGVEHKQKSETVYTYQIAFKKVGQGTDAEKLAGAVFGIYSDSTCSHLIDQVTTNSDGYGLSSKVGQGTYYVKEITAPTGYSLNTNVYNVTASWATAEYTSSSSETIRTYTTTASEAINATQIGWIYNGVFYELNETHPTAAVAAYLATEKTTDYSETKRVQNTGTLGTVEMGTPIPNTKLGALPSTGGIGTVIFSAIGSVGMLAAIAIFFANRRRVRR